MYQIYQEFLGILSKRRKKQLNIFLILIFLNSIVEVISVAAVIPFLIVISNPEKLSTNLFVENLLITLGINMEQDLRLPITLFFIFTVITAGIIRLTNLWFSGRLSVSIGSDISIEIYRRILFQEYSYHLQKKSSEIISALSSYVFQTIAVIRTILNLLTSIFISIGIILSLFFIDWKVALTSITVFSIFYLILAFFVRPLLVINSRKIADSCEKQVELLQDSLGSIRDIILDSNQNVYLNIFKKVDRSLRLKTNQNQFIGAFPKYLFEIIGFTIIAILAFLLVYKNDAGVLVIPILGAFALGAQKLLPSLQQIYSGWSTVNASLSELNIIIEMLKLPLSINSLPIKKYQKLENIIFENVSFKYSKHSKIVLKELNFKIESGEMIGLVGTTGSGKSTIVDLLMGLLIPTNGQIIVNKKNLYDKKYPERINSWRATISHVPQNIFISNTSIRDNIAFGIPKNQIDMKRLEKVAKQAEIIDFIKSSKKGFDLKVGERGSNLSGGQLQRIGIARALYKDSPILVLDEATSALDIETEKKIMKSISRLKKIKTIIIISHKKSTLNECDKIFRINKSSIFEDFEENK